MSPCGSFVSLLRSCYSTKARFFRDSDDLQDVEWYWTEPGAPWIGKENLFNARTWYGGVPDWPELGEVEDAPRTYSKGGDTRTGDPHGDDLQWLEGAYTVDALPADPCPGAPPALCQETATEGGGVFRTGFPVVEFSPEGPFFAGQDWGNPAVWWTDVMGPPCGPFPVSMDLRLTDGPPNFNEFAKCELIFENPPGNFGTWQVPADSPFFPGEQVGVGS